MRRARDHARLEHRAARRLVERALLGVINACYYLPRWCSVADYDALLTAEGLRDVRTADWTPRIAPFWPAVIRTAARPRNALKLLRTGVDGVRSALARCAKLVGGAITISHGAG